MREYEARIDNKLNLIVPVYDLDNNIVKVYIPEPARYTLDAMSEALSKCYHLIQEGISIDVLAYDYKMLIFKDSEQTKRDRLEASLERILTSAFLIWPDLSYVSYNDLYKKERSQDGSETLLYIKGVDEDVIRALKGTLLFFLALYRYTMRGLAKTDLKDYHTSLAFTEFLDSLKTASQPASHTSQAKAKRAKTSTPTSQAEIL